MNEPEMDDDGYPTEETLDAIKNWSPSDIAWCFMFMQKAWSYPDYFTVKHISGPITRDVKVLEYSISTGGWSWNESLIYALKENKMIWILAWVQSRRGGHYIFEVKQ